MVLAEKCPNCGAFLPVRQPGVRTRTCEFCELEVPGDVVPVETKQLTVRTMPAVRPMPSAGGGSKLIWIVILLPVLIGGLVAIVVFTSSKRSSSSRSVVAPVPEAAVAPAPPLPPVDRGAELKKAVAAAGGAAALDPMQLLPFAQRQARAKLADAALVSITCTPVRADGTTDLTLAGADNPHCEFEFRSPANSRRPADLPTGINKDLPCLTNLYVRPAMDDSEVNLDSRRLDECRRLHLARTPACSFADVWKRAVDAKAAPADAVAFVRFSPRHRSVYDPPDPSDEADVLERALWSLQVERDDGPDYRFETWDDCGASPPTAVEKKIAAAVTGMQPALRRCFAVAADKHPAVEAFETVWRVVVDAGGKVSPKYQLTGVDLEGMFQGSLGLVRTTFHECAGAALERLRLPAAAAGELRIIGRVTRDGAIRLAPPPYE